MMELRARGRVALWLWYTCLFMAVVGGHAYREDDTEPTIHHHRSELFMEVEDTVKEFLRGMLGDSDLLRHVVDWGMIKKGLMREGKTQEYPDYYLEHMSKNRLKLAILNAVREDKRNRIDSDLEGDAWETSLDKIGKTLDIRMVRDKAKVKLPYCKDLIYVQKQLGKWKVTWWDAFTDVEFINIPTQDSMKHDIDPVEMNERAGGHRMKKPKKGKAPPRRENLFVVDESNNLEVDDA